MEKNPNDVVSVTNISSYDFPFIDAKGENQIYRETRRTKDHAHYRRPDVPVLMWGGEVYELKAGETRQFPRFLADHFAKVIVDRKMLEAGDITTLNDKRSRDVLFAQVQGAPAPVVAPVAAPVAVEAVKPELPAAPVELESLGVFELKKIAAERGIPTTKKSTKAELLAALA